MDKDLAFKEIIREPMIVDGCGSVDKLAELIGDNNVERLKGLGIIKINDAEFSLTKLGTMFVKVFTNN